jgi:hypothetical protein
MNFIGNVSAMSSTPFSMLIIIASEIYFRQMQMQKEAMDGQLIATRDSAAAATAAATTNGATVHTEHDSIGSSNGTFENENSNDANDADDAEESPATAAARHEARVFVGDQNAAILALKMHSIARWFMFFSYNISASVIDIFSSHVLWEMN